MRIQHLIYRIELPFETEEDKAQVEELKDVLGRILLYEKTACPFRRGFTVDLPEEQESPPRRRTMGPLTPAKKWEMRDIWRREGENFRPLTSETDIPVEEQEEEEEDDNVVDNEQQLDPQADKEHIQEGEMELEQDPFRDDDTKPPIPPRDFMKASLPASAHSGVYTSSELDTDMLRKSSFPLSKYDHTTQKSADVRFDVPSTLELDASQPSILPAQDATNDVSHSAIPSDPPDDVQAAVPGGTQPHTEAEADSLLPSADRSRTSSFRSYYTSLELQPGSLPSPVSEYGDPFSNAASDSQAASTTSHHEPQYEPEDSELTIISSTSHETTSSDTTLNPPLPQPVSEQFKTASAIFLDDHPQQFDNHLYTFSSRRPRTSTSSSAPDAKRAFSNPHRKDRSTGTNVTTAFVSRTAALFLGPPSNLVSAMMQIASRLASGAMSTAGSGAGGAAYRFNLEGLPGRWEDSEEERDYDYEDDDFSIHSPSHSGRLRNDMDDDDYEDLDEDEDNGLDDFGVPLGNDTPARNGRKNWGFVKSPSPKASRKLSRDQEAASLVDRLQQTDIEHSPPNANDSDIAQSE